MDMLLATTLFPLAVAVLVLLGEWVRVYFWGGHLARGKGFKILLIFIFFLLPSISRVVTSYYGCLHFDGDLDEDGNSDSYMRVVSWGGDRAGHRAQSPSVQRRDHPSVSAHSSPPPCPTHYDPINHHHPSTHTHTHRTPAPLRTTPLQDLTSPCSGDRYNAICAYAYVMILVFPIGCPLMMICLLWSRSHDIVTRTTRGGDETLESLSFLFQVYDRKHYYMGVVDMLRRLSLGCALLFMDAEGQLVFGFVCTVTFTTACREKHLHYDSDMVKNISKF